MSPLRTRNLAQRVKTALRDDELRAIDALFQLSCRRSERHLNTIRSFDWSRLPRSADFDLADPGDRNCDQIREAGRAFLMTAIEELLENNERAGSELEVLRAMRLRLEGIPAQQLGEHLESDPVRRRDPKTYRNWIVAYGYAQVRDWARGDAPAAGNGYVADEVPDPATLTNGGPITGWMRWTAAVVVLVAAAVLLYAANRPVEDEPPYAAPDLHAAVVPVARLGLNLHARPGGTGPSHLDSVVPRQLLPNLGNPLFSATLIARSDSLRNWPHAFAPLDSVFVALGTEHAGYHSGHVALWDPMTDAVVWEYEFEQRPGEADMNPDLPADAGQQSYRVVALAHSSPFGSLGPDRLVAIFQQKFSPCFVVLLDLRTGEELARYASYGTLYDPLIVDIDDDGDVEIVLAGTDNACDAATVTVLDPEMGDGATSSVGWNTEGEGALWRVILPDPRALFEGYFASHEIPYWPGAQPPRLHTNSLGPQSWNPRTRRLELSVGPSPDRHIYEVTLVDGRPDFSVPVIRLGDMAEQVWRSMGLDPAVDPGRVARRTIVVEQGDGYRCVEGMEKVGELEP